jgi:hypothetical protein
MHCNGPESNHSSRAHQVLFEVVEDVCVQRLHGAIARVWGRLTAAGHVRLQHLGLVLQLGLSQRHIQVLAA